MVCFRAAALAFLLLAAGCALTPTGHVARPVPVAATTDMPAAETQPSAVAAANLDGSTLAASAATLPGPTTLIPESEEELGEEAEAAADEDVLAAAVDPETIEDNLLLIGPDQEAPEEIGANVEPLAGLFDFPVVENQQVRYFIDYYTGPGRSIFARWLERSTRYHPMMQKIFAEYGLPQDLVYLAMVESGYNPKAYSWAHASGPWQFIRGTGRIFGLHDDWWRDERRDFEKSTRAAARYLKELQETFPGNWYLSVASYNCGAGAVARAISRGGSRDFWELSQGKFLPEETRNYVPKLLAVLLIAKQPEKYGFVGLNNQPPLHYETVTVPSTTDLEVVARLCGVTYEEIKQLNPELKRWSTPPGVKDYQLRLPLSTSERFLSDYALLPADQRANYEHHVIKSGDTLQGLAKRYRIRVDDILALNTISNPRALKVGRSLILPLRKGLSRLPLEELGDDYARTVRPAVRTHTVKKGDTLGKLAKRFAVSERELRAWNRLGKKAALRPGQKLVVSAGAKGKGKGTNTAKVAAKGKASGKVTKTGKTKTQTVAKSESKTKVSKIVYKVKAGDTLSGIARRYDVPVARIRDWNKLSSGHVLRPGDQIKLMVAGASRG